MEIIFEVNNQIVKRKDKTQVPVDCSSGYLRLKFDFKTSDWSNVSKYVFFITPDTSYRYGLVEDKVTVPTALLSNKKKLVFGVYGSNANTRITTNPVILHLLESKYPDSFGENPSEEYNQDEIEEIYTALLSYYTKTEVDNLLVNLKHDLENKIIITGSRSIVQDDGSVSFTARLKRDGFVVRDAVVYFYKVE